LTVHDWPSGSAAVRSVSGLAGRQNS
jgi:hypothetical protein